MYAGYSGQATGPPSGQMPLRPSGYPASSQYLPPGSSYQSSMAGYYGDNLSAAPTAPNYGTNPTPIDMYYGASQPVNSAYSWSQPQTQPPYNGCVCTTLQCMCGRRRAA
ncbi:hypothetical protein K438DRAFT_173691 [Mycena galopus ATCC 62051]|nr:hypothetical protein K438DRAFT_173691 [Mycena galopus ATCC 62051]